VEGADESLSILPDYKPTVRPRPSAVDHLDRDMLQRIGIRERRSDKKSKVNDNTVCTPTALHGSTESSAAAALSALSTRTVAQRARQTLRYTPIPRTASVSTWCDCGGP
jgi:hypothetical protein